ncbi:MAG: hypothetical protein JW776_03390 [Candidatus Lokiarchaeota archaeon]|nr:hypothetical protein [Candidatus Lokiarchaeota archaeon]
MSSISFYDWEKSLQSNPSSQLTISSPSPKKKDNSIKKPKGTIDYFISEDNQEQKPKSHEEPLDELNDIGDIIFRKIVELWKMKNLD